jgi:hypothetical protein
MSTATANTYNTTYNNPATLNKPVPGEVITQTTITQNNNNYAQPTYHKGFEVFSTIFAVIAGVGMWLGAALILTAMALVLRDVNYHYTSIGGLLIAGFSLWFLAHLANWIPNFGGFGKNTRSGYHIFNFFGNMLALIAMALFIAGAACWLSFYGNARYAGEILWVIAGSFWVASMLVRDLGVRYDAMNTYKNYPVGGNLNDTDKKMLGAHVSSIWSNALATDLYLISSVLFLLGAIMFVARGRNYDQNFYTAGQFQVAAAILWLVGSGIVLFASILHCIARR